jgi:antitoxin (DNA-binding transcriptional repressor) of toxin-antitoxin stability system
MMKTISMVDLRTNSERIVRDLKRGEHMILSYRGKPLAELVPSLAATKKMTPLAALNQAQMLTSQDAHYAEKTEAYLRELREDQKAWGEKTPA